MLDVAEDFLAWARRYRIQLFDWQVDAFGQATKREHGRFLHRLAGISVSRGNGKSYGASAVACWRLQHGPQPQLVLSCALDLEGSKVCLDAGKTILSSHPELARGVEFLADELRMRSTGSRWIVRSREHTASRGLHPDVVLYDEIEAAWCAMPRSLSEAQDAVGHGDTRLWMPDRNGRPVVLRPAPLPTDVRKLIAQIEAELAEDVGGADGQQGVQLTMPGPWTQESNGAYTHPTHGAVHIHQNGTWTHLLQGRIKRRGTGQAQLTEYAKSLRGTSADPGPAGTSIEHAHEILHHALTGPGTILQEHRPEPERGSHSQLSDVHAQLHRALTGAPAPVKLAEGAHEKLAKALGHDGRVIQEDADGTPSDESPHVTLARALRGH